MKKKEPPTGWFVPEKLSWDKTPRDEWALELAGRLKAGETAFKWEGTALVLASKDVDGKLTVWDATIQRIWRCE